MKLYYDKRLSDSTYYIQINICHNSKISSKSIGKIGKHSELFKSHKDHFAYTKDYILYLNNSDIELKIQIMVDFNNRLSDTDDILNIGYFYLNFIYRRLNVNQFLDTAISNKVNYNYIGKTKK